GCADGRRLGTGGWGASDGDGEGGGLLRSRHAVRDPRGPRARRRARRSPDPRLARQRLRLGPSLLARRRAAQAAGGRLDLRPRDDGARREARGAREDRLAGPPAQRGRSRRLTLLLSVRALLRVPGQRAGGVPGEDRAAARSVAVPTLPRRVRRVLLPASARRDLRGPGSAAR